MQNVNNQVKNQVFYHTSMYYIFLLRGAKLETYLKTWSKTFVHSTMQKYLILHLIKFDKFSQNVNYPSFWGFIFRGCFVRTRKEQVLRLKSTGSDYSTVGEEGARLSRHDNRETPKVCLPLVREWSGNDSGRRTRERTSGGSRDCSVRLNPGVTARGWVSEETGLACRGR